MDSSPNDIFTGIHSPNPLEEATERVRGVIKARLINPGDRLPPERELATQLGVSRSTLRVALQSLMDGGWLEVRRGRNGGSFVSRWPEMPSPCQLAEILTRHSDELPSLLDYRRAVEMEAAACAAQRSTSADWEALESLNNALRLHTDNLELYRAHDAQLHIGIVRAAHSPRLMAAATEVQAAIAEVLDVTLYHVTGLLHDIPNQHERILSAIRSRDERVAREAMLDHILATEAMIADFLPSSHQHHEHEMSVAVGC